MIDNYRYGVLPYEIQIIILKMGLEHPLSSIIKKTKKNLPKPIFEESSFFDLYFLFFINSRVIHNHFLHHSSMGLDHMDRGF